MISVSDVFFPQLSNDVGSFPEIFNFHLQKVQNVWYLKKYIFNIFCYPLDRKLSIFYVGKDISQRVPVMFSVRNRMRKSFWRSKWKISEKLPTSLESWGKNELEIARFGARAPRAGAVDVKCLIYTFIPFESFTVKLEPERSEGPNHAGQSAP